MTSEEFWDIFISNKAVEVYNETYQFFKEGLPADFEQEYDVIEIILETTGHLETAKEFKKYIAFSNLIRDKYPHLHKETFQYIESTLISYNLFNNNPKAVTEAFDCFIKNPLVDIDHYLVCFNSIMFYQYDQLLYRAIHQNYETIHSKGLHGNLKNNLLMAEFYRILEAYDADNHDMALKDFILEHKKISEKTFLVPEAVHYLDIGLSEDNALKKDMSVKKEPSNEYLILVQTVYLRYMKNYGFSFVFSGYLWGRMCLVWEAGNKNTTDLASYFLIDTMRFKNVLDYFLNNSFVDNRHERVAVIWGAMYVYDFLLEEALLTEEQYRLCTEVIQELKGHFMVFNSFKMWDQNFVHTWKKPQGVPQNEFNAEKSIFKKSMDFTKTEYNLNKSMISEELEAMGEFKKYLDKGEQSYTEWEEKTRSNFMAMDSFFDKNDDDGYYKKSTPIIAEKKPGRNEPCYCGSGKKYKKCCLNASKA